MVLSRRVARFRRKSSLSIQSIPGIPSQDLDTTCGQEHGSTLVSARYKLEGQVSPGKALSIPYPAWKDVLPLGLVIPLAHTSNNSALIW